MTRLSVLTLGRRHSVQFSDDNPTIFQVTRVLDWEPACFGWVWLEGYQLDDKGEAIDQRKVLVIASAVGHRPEVSR